MSDANIIRERIDGGPLAPAMVLAVGIAFMLNLLDGFDVVAISVVATALSEDWGIPRGQLGPIFSAALVGMALGAALLAPFADRFGRRIMLLCSTIAIGIAMIATGMIPGGLGDVAIGPWKLSGSILLLIGVRLFAGLGVGVILANAAAIASEAVPEKHRDFAVLIAIMGYPCGAMIVGPVANGILATAGWEVVFIYGGIASLGMGLIIWLFLPESVDFLSSKADRSEKELNQVNTILRRLRREPIDALPERLASDSLQAASVKSILVKEFRVDTLMLWTTYFMGFSCIYFLLTWIPTLFVDAGYSRAQGIQALTYTNGGALVGILIIGMWAKKMKLAKPIFIFFLGAALSLALISLIEIKDATALNVMIFITGLLVNGGFTGLYALAARYYPTRVRATGIGWSAGLGRVGAIVSPIIAGLLAASGWGMHSLFLVFAIPLVIAAALILRFRI